MVVAAAAIVAAGTVATGAISSASSSGQRKAAANLANKQAEAAQWQSLIARDLFQETRPLRVAGQSQLGRFLRTGEAPTALIPAFAPVRETAESQYDVARENILGRTGSRGGLLSQQLGQLELDRAQTISGLEAPLRQELFNKGLAVGFQQPALAMTGLQGAGAGFGGAAGTFGQLAQQAAQQQQNWGSSAGSAAALAAMLAKKQQQAGGAGGGSASVW